MFAVGNTLVHFPELSMLADHLGRSNKLLPVVCTFNQSLGEKYKKAARTN